MSALRDDHPNDYADASEGWDLMGIEDGSDADVCVCTL